MSSPAPVILFVYNRPRHTERALLSLSACPGAGETELFIFSDGPKSAEDSRAVAEVRSLCRDLTKGSVFLSATVREAKENRGLARSVTAAVSEIIDEYGRVIVLEDDLVCSPDFLSFMNDALTFYEQDKRIWSISGYTPRITLPKRYHHDVYCTVRASSYGYGTWKDRWKTVDWNVSDYASFRRSPLQRRRFNRGGLDMAEMLDNQMRGSIDSWAVRWCYAQFKQGMYTVYPRISRVQNIGFDNSGTHGSEKDRKFEAEVSDSPVPYTLEQVPVSRTAARRFRRLYGTRLERFREKLAWYRRRLSRLVAPVRTGKPEPGEK